MTSLATYCRRCETDYDLDRGDIAQGYKWWSLCPACRQSDANELPRPDEDADDDMPGAAGPQAD